jgi:hypothetical protein
LTAYNRTVDESLENLNCTFHRVRQAHIDEGLFDLVSSFEALRSSIAQDYGSAKNS